MKIAIRGHQTREKEVARILKSLGGKNHAKHTFVYKDLLYYLDSDNFIICSLVAPSGYREYTLEEFEKEFPFKIGDEVKDRSDGEIGVITDLIFIDNTLMYNVDLVNSGQAFMLTEHLEPYKEMKEERNITLTLDKAQEWYKKGGELKEVALQAFTETELNPLPRSWEEFCKKYPIKDKEAHIDSISSIVIQNGNATWRTSVRDRNICPSEKSAEAHLAMIQLEQLRDCWRQGWEPECHTTSYAIKRCNDEIHVIQAYSVSAFLSFPTQKMANDFLACFRDLIEKAGDLI